MRLQAPAAPPAAAPAAARAAADTTPINSRDEWKKKINALIDEWVSIRSEEEAELCFTELRPRGQPKQAANFMVEFALEKVVDCGEQERLAVAQLLIILISGGNLAPENFVAPVYNAALEFLEDYEIDIPQVHNNLAQVLAELIKVDMVEVKTLHQQCTSAPWENKTAPAQKLFTAIHKRLPLIGATSGQIAEVQAVLKA